MSTTPKHFPNSTRFTRYVYTVAIRDLTALVHANTPQFCGPDEDSKRVIEETRAEIRAIRARLKRLPDI